MRKNSYIEQRDAIRREFFSAGMELAAQQTFDMLCLVLHDPEVMGKNIFGAERLKRLNTLLREREAMFHEAWLNNPETDWYQEKLDDALRDIFGEIVPFAERYPYQRKWNYMKPAKENSK